MDTTSCTSLTFSPQWAILARSMSKVGTERPETCSIFTSKEPRSTGAPRRSRSAAAARRRARVQSRRHGHERVRRVRPARRDTHPCPVRVHGLRTQRRVLARLLQTAIAIRSTVRRRRTRIGTARLAHPLHMRRPARIPAYEEPQGTREHHRKLGPAQQPHSTAMEETIVHAIAPSHTAGQTPHSPTSRPGQSLRQHRKSSVRSSPAEGP